MGRISRENATATAAAAAAIPLLESSVEQNRDRVHIESHNDFHFKKIVAGGNGGKILAFAFYIIPPRI